MTKTIRIEDLKPAAEELTDKQMKQVRGGGVTATGSD